MIVFKFVEHPENNEKPMDQKSRVKFKIMSLKVNGPMDYVPELVGLQTLFRFAPVSFHFFFSILFSYIGMCSSLVLPGGHYQEFWNPCSSSDDLILSTSPFKENPFVFF